MCMKGHGKIAEEEGATSKRPVFVLRGISHFFMLKGWSGLQSLRRPLM